MQVMPVLSLRASWDATLVYLIVNNGSGQAARAAELTSEA